MSAETWKVIHASRTYGRWPPESVVAYFCRTFPFDRRQIRVLDLGCGAGACTRMLVDEGFSVVAMDCSADALQQVRHGLRKWELPHCDLAHGDITQRLPFEDGSFDVVLDNLSLTHVEDFPRRQAMMEIHRILKTEGSLITRQFAVFCDEIRGVGYVHYADGDSLHADAEGLFSFRDSFLEGARSIKIRFVEFIK